MKALGFLGLGHQGISFEKLLSRSGVKIKMGKKYSERQFRQFTQEGVSIKLDLSSTKKN
jgi:ketol-acid reductoisomerase